jgi:uncharacterized protein GlcG (DUF336 family)
MDGNEIIGAEGVSSGTADEDELCAIAGIRRRDWSLRV